MIKIQVDYENINFNEVLGQVKLNKLWINYGLGFVLFVFKLS